MPDKRARTHISGTYTSSSSVLRDQPTNASSRSLPGATTRRKDSIIFISSDSEFGPDHGGASSDIEIFGNSGPFKPYSHANSSRVDWKQKLREAEWQLGEQARKATVSQKKSDEILTLQEKLTNVQNEIKAAMDAYSLREREDKELLESVRESLSCKICFEPLEKPYVLPACGHEFCGDCLRDWMTRHQDAINANGGDAVLGGGTMARTNPRPIDQECPTCRAPIKTRPVQVYLLKTILDLVKTPAERKLVKTDAKVESDASFWEAFFHMDDDRGRRRKSDQVRRVAARVIPAPQQVVRAPLAIPPPPPPQPIRPPQAQAQAREFGHLPPAQFVPNVNQQFQYPVPQQQLAEEEAEWPRQNMPNPYHAHIQPQAPPPPVYWVPPVIAPQPRLPIPQWTLPSYSDPVRINYALAHAPGLTANERALLQRGASLELVHQLQMEYSDDQGICATIWIDYSSYHLHFGWNFPSAWMPIRGEYIRTVIRRDVLSHPERYSVVNACMYRLVRRQ